MSFPGKNVVEVVLIASHYSKAHNATRYFQFLKRGSKRGQDESEPMDLVFHSDSNQYQEWLPPNDSRARWVTLEIDSDSSDMNGIRGMVLRFLEQHKIGGAENLTFVQERWPVYSPIAWIGRPRKASLAEPMIASIVSQQILWDRMNFERQRIQAGDDNNTASHIAVVVLSEPEQWPDLQTYVAIEILSPSPRSFFRSIISNRTGKLNLAKVVGVVSMTAISAMYMWTRPDSEGLDRRLADRAFAMHRERQEYAAAIAFEEDEKFLHDAGRKVVREDETAAELFAQELVGERTWKRDSSDQNEVPFVKMERKWEF